jgi:hypothetical protein
VPLSRVEDELTNPADIGLLGASAEVPGADPRCGRDPGNERLVLAPAAS